jgi:hypothetical protein
MDETEPVECSSCLAEPDIDVDTNQPIMKGWNLEGEFGALCPECAGDAEVGSDEGLGGVIEALGAKKKDE